MKKEYFLPLFFFHRVVPIAIVLVIGLGFVGCKSPRSESTDWLNLTIKFKTGSTEEIRQATLNAIESNVIDTIRKLQNTFKDFNPSISRIRKSVGDSLSFSIKVTSPSVIGTPQICLCSTGCRICRTVNDLHVQPVSTPGFATIDVIETIDTDHDKPKGDSDVK